MSYSTAPATANTRPAPPSNSSPPSLPFASIPICGTKPTSAFASKTAAPATSSRAGRTNPFATTWAITRTAPSICEAAVAESCNAYFAQLGTYNVGASALHDTAALLDIPAGDPREIKKMMPFAAYGQGPVLVTPFKMARVAATIANAGDMPQGRWISGDANPRTDLPRPILAPNLSDFLRRAMRRVVQSGTARGAMNGSAIPIAGKTGTAQVEQGQPHSWFAGFAPYGGDPAKQIAFAVVVEHGGYGAEIAAPLARQIIEAAHELGII